MKINSTLCVHFRQWIIHNDCRTIRNNHQMDKELITENCWRNFKLRLGLDGKRKMCCVLDIHKLSLFSIDWFYCCALINIAEIKDILQKQLDEEMRINYEQWNISTKKLPRVKINFNVEGNLCGGGKVLSLLCLWLRFGRHDKIVLKLQVTSSAPRFQGYPISTSRAFFTFYEQTLRCDRRKIFCYSSK